MFHSFGAAEAAVIIVVVLIVFGVGKLPQVGGALGKGLREFRRGKAGDYEELKELEKPQETENKQDD
ncbi:MAG: twin-arginine translocase TatA/TatE family subunit [Dehalococcoidia bacterium]